MTLGYVNIGNYSINVNGNGVSIKGIDAGNVYIYSTSGIVLDSADGDVTSRGNFGAYATAGNISANGISAANYLTIRADNGGISTGYLSGSGINLYAGYGSINTNGNNIFASGYVYLESHNSDGGGNISISNVTVTSKGSFTAIAPDGGLTMGSLTNGYGGTIGSASITTGYAFNASYGGSILADNLTIHYRQWH